MSKLPARGGGPEQRRRYDSPLRRREAANTRASIVAAGVDLVRELSTWEWDELTFRAVAAKAAVSERTVYRHFPTQRLLHAAVLAALQEDTGVGYDGLDLDRVAHAAGLVFSAVRKFAVEDAGSLPRNPVFSDAERRRHAALNRAVGESAPDWTDDQRTVIAGLLDVLWNPMTFERLVRVWKLDDTEATEAVQWLINKVVEAVQQDERPLPKRRPRKR